MLWLIVIGGAVAFALFAGALAVFLIRRSRRAVAGVRPPAAALSAYDLLHEQIAAQDLSVRTWQARHHFDRRLAAIDQSDRRQAWSDQAQHELGVAQAKAQLQNPEGK